MATHVFSRGCCFCGVLLTGWGNNPEPVKDGTKYRCCDSCNVKIVIPARLREWLDAEYKHKEENDEKEN